MTQYHNPIIPGFHPDPSICRAEDNFYLVNSTFEFFPGVPIYHSKNLVNWELIGHCLTNDDQLGLLSCPDSGGIYAPTIRYNNGTFYMITTNVSGIGNFIVHTKDIRGPWSLPHKIEHIGIDPSLFFDDDGKAYLCATCLSDNCQGIGLSPINPDTGERLGEMRIITFGTGGKYPEGPHLYKINGEYYLMIAEGGTEYGHMETIFRSNKLWGSYESCPYNPIISHRNAMGNPIQAIGHADLIEDQNGHWWLVCLGIRPLSGRLLHNLGRETFLVPVIWGEDGWPLVGDGGLVHETMEGPLPGPAPFCESLDFEDNFSSGRFKVEWNFVRNPRKENYSIGNNRLMLQAGPESLSDARPTFLGVRQKNIKASARTRVMIEPLIGAIAGITTYYNTKYHYELSICQDAEGAYIRLSATVHGMECMILNERIPLVGPVELLVKTDDDFYTFYYRIKDDWIMAGKVVTAGLCTESTATMTFTGVYLGVFASNATAQFDYFTVKNSI